MESENEESDVIAQPKTLKAYVKQLTEVNDSIDIFTSTNSFESERSFISVTFSSL